ncbi:MAG: four helix bundle protein [Nitrospirota bacterium]
MAKTFEETDVWKESRELVKLVYKLTNGTAFRKDHGLVDQVRRASVSILSNIAEGFERGSNAELVHFLYVAKGSAGELRAQMYVALDQGYITNDDRSKVHDRCMNISSQIAGLIKYLKRSGLKGSKFNNQA